jgi:transposase
VVIPVKPGQCRRGQHPLQGADPPPQRPQVTESPRVKPVVPAYPLHRLVGPGCGEATRAAWPGGVPRGGFGPRVQAITALGTGAEHLANRPTQTLLEALGGVSLGLGPGAHLEQALGQALVEPGAEARADVQAPPAASLDETGGREGRPRAWWWTAGTAGVTVCVRRVSRGGNVARALVGERCWGGWVTERWSADPG